MAVFTAAGAPSAARTCSTSSATTSPAAPAGPSLARRRWRLPRAPPGTVHLYWRLNGRFPSGEIESANSRLALALGGDLSSVDIARVLRPPETRNHKHRPPRAVSLLAYRASAVYALEELVADLPELAYAVPTAERAHRASAPHCPGPPAPGDPSGRLCAGADRVALRIAPARSSAPSMTTTGRACSSMAMAPFTASAAGAAGRSTTSPRICGEPARVARSSSR